MVSSRLAVTSLSLTLLAIPFPSAQATMLHVGTVAAMHGHGPISNHGAPAQGYLGIMFHDVSDNTYNTQHLKEKRGAEIVMVDHDGPAGKAGLREHDVVLSMNGTNVDGEEQLRKMLHDMQPGRIISLYICRDGVERSVSATLSTREEVNKQAMLQRWSVPAPVDESTVATDTPEPAPLPNNNKGGMFSHSFMSGHLLPLLPVYTGAVVDTMGPQLAAYFGIKDGKGLLVRSVEGNSAAASAGLHAGDVVTRMNGGHVNTERDWQRALHDAKGKPITLIVIRERKELTMTMVADGKKRSAVTEPKFGADNSPLLM